MSRYDVTTCFQFESKSFKEVTSLPSLAAVSAFIRTYGGEVVHVIETPDFTRKAKRRTVESDCKDDLELEEILLLHSQNGPRYIFDETVDSEFD